jgi:Cu-Zn family superoxide dismutase
MLRSPRWILLALLSAVLSVTVGVVASSGKEGRADDDSTTGTTTTGTTSTGTTSTSTSTSTTTTTTTTGDDKGGDRDRNDKKGSSKGTSSKRAAFTYTIPGDAVFPEGIAVDKRSSDDDDDDSPKRFFVSSTTDGTIFKGSVKGSRTLAAFAPAGADGRTTAIGLEVSKSRLFVAGGQTGKAFVLSTKDGSTLKVLDSKPPSADTFINDVTVADGYAYFTDSRRPIIFRASTRGGSIGDLEPWLDLTGTPFVYQTGFNANGIVNYDDGKVLVVVQSNTGKLFRISTRSKKVSEIALGGATVTNGDGLVAHGSRLYVVRNANNEIVEIKLRRNKREGRIESRITSDKFGFPTTAARVGNRLLVVNSQFDKRGGTPVLPFTVASVRKP